MTLGLYYQINFSLVQHNTWSGEYIDSLYPFERELYVSLLSDFIKQQEAAANKNAPFKGEEFNFIDE